MTQDEIIEMAKAAGGTAYVNRHYPGETSFAFGPKAFEAFVKLVDAKATDREREACADLCAFVTWSGPWKSAAVALSNLIRARGQE